MIMDKISLALAGIWCISLLFREEDPAPERGH